jgi:hypothetical protein
MPPENKENVRERVLCYGFYGDGRTEVAGKVRFL